LINGGAVCLLPWRQNGDVTELVLTAERRDQLAALLDDEQRLWAEFPKVHEYLDMAARLPGTGDSRADADFDVRFAHYMTGGRSVSANPYWDIVASSVFEDGGRRVVNGGRPEGSARLAFAQMVLQASYAYAIPSPETVAWVSQFCGGRRVVELGAGRGYWAAQLSAAGLVVDAYELEPPDESENVSFPRAEGQLDVWYPVAGIESLRFDGRSEDVLLLCWPPGWGNTMASNALAAFERAGGDRLIYIGEPRGGKTGDDAFFDGLSVRWELESADPRFVSWWNLADVAQGWVRR
jgi:hypothetical protein